MKRVLQYRLITLVMVMVVAAIGFAILFLPSRLERRLREDLKLAPTAKLSIVDHSIATRVIAVTEVDSTYTLFVAFNDGNLGWYVPIVVGSGAPAGVPEATFEYSQDFDHWPTPKEIDAFRAEYGLR